MQSVLGTPAGKVNFYLAGAWRKDLAKGGSCRRKTDQLLAGLIG